jgi:transcriptional regulator with XRE-family HTH domain
MSIGALIRQGSEGPTVGEGSPTVRRRRLGLLLRDLRQRKGLTGDQAGREIERSASWISRVEAGRTGLRPRDLRDLLDLYEVHDQTTRNQFLTLAEEGKRHGWWSQYAEAIPEPYAQYIGLEDGASVVRAFEPRVVPGLLQTADYARAVTLNSPLSPRIDPKITEELVQVRLRRQQLLRRLEEPVRLVAVLEEAVLRRAFGGRRVLCAQLDHLIDEADRPNVEVHVIRYVENVALAPPGPFCVLQYSPSVPSAVYLENLSGGYFERDEHTAVYESLFNRLLEASLGTNDSVELIRAIRNDLYQE